MSEENLNYAEFGVAKKAEGANKLKRILLVCLYILFTLVYAGFFVIVKVPQVIAVLPVFVWMLIFFTWHYVKFDYEYRIELGEMIFTIAYTPKKKRELLRFKVKDAEQIMPLSEADFSDIGEYTAYDYRGSVKSESSYIATFKRGEEKVLVYFEATGKLVKLMHRLNEKTVVSKELRY